MATDDDSEVPESGAVFTFGKSKFNDNVPGKFWIRDDKVVLVNCGDEHTALVAESGRVFTFGSNEWGQLGLGHDKPVNKPSRIKSLKNDPINLACCGKSHTILASRSGRLYGFGANNDGQVGNGEEKDKVLKPVHLKTLEDQQFSMLAAGSEHSAALTVSGDLYVWGGSSEGQLGFGDDESVNIPTKLDFDEKVTCVSCGYYHTAVVTESGKLYAFGETEDGKLGIGESPAENKSPQEVTDIEGSVVWVACGGTQTIAVTDSGRVYSFGNGSNGQLGHGTLSLQTPKPMNIGLPKSAKVKTSSCGNSHSAIVTEKGQLFTFGDGRHGKLALGEENFANQFKPTFVDRFEKFVVEGVSCGGCHMLVLAKPKLQNGDAWSEEDAEEEEEEEMPNGHGIEAIMKREGLSTSMDPDGSIVARNRRREKMPDPSGTLNRTLPPLNSTVRTSSSTLPPLGGSGDAPDNPLNRGRLAPIHTEKENSTMSAKPKKDSGDESGIEESGDEQPAIKKETSNTQRSLPQPRPRPAKRVDQQSDEEGKHENEDSEHDSVDSSKQKDDDDDGEPKPVPAARRPAKKQSEDEEEEEEEEQQQLKQISQSQSTKSKKPAASEDEEEEEKEDEEEDKKKKGKEKKKKEKDKKKKKISFFGKKQADSEEEDEEKENDEDEEEEEDDKKKKGKDKKAKKEKNKKKEKEKKSKKKAKDSEEEEDDLEEEEEEEEEEVSEEEDTAARGIFGRRKNNKKDKKKKEKEKDKKKKQKKKKEEEEEEETEDEEEEEEEKKPEPKPKVTVEPPKEKEEKKDEPKKEEPKKEEPKKKSRTCTIL